ncbi:restriction endonuclease subunit S [Eshraghiella crossota]|uniref:restriction endonuclease subunit S n=1 Tax=Eshraghiella crossota TaxID=45851 RepID=UPI003FF07566
MSKIKLTQVCDITTGKLDANAAEENGRYPYFTCAPEPLTINSYAFDEDAILLAGNNAAGNFHCQRYNGKFNAYQRTYVITARDGYDIEYIFYCLKINLELLRKKAQGSQTKFLTMQLLDAFEIDDIPLAEQKRIAYTLSDIDSKIENNKKINAELESMAKTIYDYWFLQFEFPNEEGKPYKSSGGKMVWNEELKREIPEGWEVSHVKDCIKHINTGLNPRDNFVLGNGSIKYITVKNLTTDGTIDFSGCDMIDEEARVIVHNRSDVSKKDILFASIAPLGRCAIVHENPTDWDINESVFCIRPNNNIVSTEYLYMFFMSDYFIKKAEHNSTGSVFSGIRISSLEDMIITIPPEKIKDNFVKAIRETLYMKYENEKQNQELASLRDFLLPMLMNGQIGFKDGER